MTLEKIYKKYNALGFITDFTLGEEVRIMKKLLLSVVLSALLLSVTACGGEVQTDSAVSDGTGWYIPSEPDYYKDISNDYLMNEPVEAETEYSNIVAYAEQGEYPADEAVIEYHIKNNNKSKGFWYHDCLLVQFYNGWEWTTLPLTGSAVRDAISAWWFHCGMDDEGYAVIDGRCDLNERLAVEVIPGQYRIVRFVANRALYIEFEIV